MFTPFIALAISAATASASCIHGTSLHRREAAEGGKVKVSAFGYTAEKGPLNWAALDSEKNAACSTGKTQSPIVIDDSVPKATSAPQVNIPTVEEAEFENLGSTLEVVLNGSTTFEGKEYKLKQFHFHTPSEHRIRDEYYPLEMHMVHESDDGSFAVIGLNYELTEDGSTTELLTSTIEHIDDVKEPGSVTKTGKLDFTEIAEVVASKPIFKYTGSLTTPPCKEGITFLIVEEPLKLNVKTYNALKSVMKFNSRYTQNKLGSANLIQVGAQSSQLSCQAVNGTETSPSSAVGLQSAVSARSVPTERMMKKRRFTVDQ